MVLSLYSNWWMEERFKFTSHFKCFSLSILLIMSSLFSSIIVERKQKIDVAQLQTSVKLNKLNNLYFKIVLQSFKIVCLFQNGEQKQLCWISFRDWSNQTTTIALQSWREKDGILSYRNLHTFDSYWIDYYFLLTSTLKEASFPHFKKSVLINLPI